MREIKFRLWDGKNMSEVFYLEEGENKQSPVIVGMRSIGIWMQFTGLKDKNGKEIYEGDIVDLGERGRKAVVWHDGAMGFIFDSNPNDPNATTIRVGRKSIKANRKRGFLNAEVIGNIYENPELLKA